MVYKIITIIDNIQIIVCALHLVSAFHTVLKGLKINVGKTKTMTLASEEFRPHGSVRSGLSA